MNKLRDEIYRVMDEKGLHAITYTQQETLIFRQLAHLANEWGEVWEATLAAAKTDFENVLSDTAVIEELADILIVAYDLAALGGIDLPDELPITNQSVNGIIKIMQAIAETCKEYRKSKSLGGLTHVVNLAAETIVSWGGDPLAAVQTKMAKNRARPYQYGVAV